MPTVNLTDHQLQTLAPALRILLDLDEAMALIATEVGLPEYPNLSGRMRRNVLEVWAVADAVAREHAPERA